MVSESQSSCPSLRLLQITDNQLQDWAEVRKFGRMYPGLGTLVLANNSLDSVNDAQETLQRLFPNLRSINLNNSGLTTHLSTSRFLLCDVKRILTVSVCLCGFSGLSKWEDIARLNFFPKLEEVKAMGIPLLQPYTTHERRCLLLAQ